MKSQEACKPHTHEAQVKFTYPHVSLRLPSRGDTDVNMFTSSGTGDTGVFLMGSTGAASAFCTPGNWGGLGTMASQAATRGRPRAPKTKKRPLQPRVASRRGDRKSPTRFPA